LAIPLITKADGTKYGKTEGGAIWLSADLMSPYAFYQFWLNVADVEVPGLLRFYSFKSREEIESLIAQGAERPAARAGQRALAEEITTLVHGAEETRRVIAASQAAFGQAEPAQLDKRLWKAMAEELPHVTYRPGFVSPGGTPTMLSQVPPAPEQVGSPHGASTFSAGAPSIASLMVSAGTASTLSAARRAIAEGGV